MKITVHSVRDSLDVLRIRDEQQVFTDIDPIDIDHVFKELIQLFDNVIAQDDLGQIVREFRRYLTDVKTEYINNFPYRNTPIKYTEYDDNLRIVVFEGVVGKHEMFINANELIYIQGKKVDAYHNIYVKVIDGVIKCSCFPHKEESWNDLNSFKVNRDLQDYCEKLPNIVIKDIGKLDISEKIKVAMLNMLKLKS